MLVGGWRMLSAVAILIAILTPGARVSAQDSKVAPAAQQGHSHSRRQTLDERVERLAKYLNLSDGQRSVLKEILLERQQEILKLRHTASSGKELQMDRFRAVEDKTVERIHAILNDDQRKKYDPLGVRSQVSDAQRQGVDGWMKAMPK